MLTQKYEVMILILKLDVIRVAELGSLSSGAKMALEIFVKRVFTIFATNLQILLSKICNIYHVIVHFLPKKYCFGLKKALFWPKISKKCVNRDKS